MKNMSKPGGFDARFDKLLLRIKKAQRESGGSLGTSLPDEEERRALAFALAPDEGGYYMPNLQGCLPFPIDRFYEFLKAGKPGNKEEFIAIVSLELANLKSRRKVLTSIRENGLEMTICSLESFYRLLASYEIEGEQAQLIVRDVINARGHLREWEELVLSSHEVSACITDQFDNIVSLSSEELSASVASVILQACHLKLDKGYPIEEIDPLVPKAGFVGPFFWIDGTVISKRIPVGGFDVRRRFFDAELSHMQLFETLGLDGDYGNHPRGRVLYDNFRGRFLIYADADLLQNKTKEKLKDHFGLFGQRCVFRKDEHYTHDGL